jgi:peptidoglycan/xylan/chitin deacetylase (PgdA/CDA1 family)
VAIAFAYFYGMFYFVKTPWWLKKIYPSLVWEIHRDEKALYLTFDDGPHETATPFVLKQLKQYNAKASFFCIGKNVVGHPEIYQAILEDGHAVGNHTHNHLNGWKTARSEYLRNIQEAAKHINSKLFRPPYGRITNQQIKLLKQSPAASFSIIMWDVLSGDFDINLAPEACLQNVLKGAEAGSIIVFHDSAKAYERMSFALPRLLEHFSKQGYVFKAL